MSAISSVVKPRAYTDFRAALLSGQTSCEAEVQKMLERIKENTELNAFLEVWEESALEQARATDAAVKAGTVGKLAGMVLGLKDNICVKDKKVSASSKILEGFTSLYSATVVERLAHEGAIFIGRLNCDEFAMGSSNENSAFGRVKNPYDLETVPGGSSGGSAAAVAAGLCHVALGSDTGGSIRQPASFCGLVGMKPTYGRVSRYGLIAYASSFDQIGPLANTVEDTALVLQVMAGKDEHDSTSSSKPVDDYVAARKGKKKYKIAYLKEAVEHSAIHEHIRTQLNSQLDNLKAQGHTVEGISFPYLDYLVPCYYVLTTAEASSNLSRFGGVTYGHRSKEATNVEEVFSKSRSEGFGAEVKRRILLGTFVLSAGYYDAYYSKGQKVRQLIRQKTLDVFKDYDFILLPTTPKSAFKAASISDPVTMYLEDIFTVQANITGVPAISLPLLSDVNGMPVGLQLMGRPFEEAAMMDISEQLVVNTNKA